MVLKKKIGFLSVCLISMLLLIGCNQDQVIGFDETIETDMKQLSRVDVQQINSDGSFEDVTTIGDKDSVDLLRKIFVQIEWEQDKKVTMSRDEDVKANLFFNWDKNMPERIFEYSIWFETGGNATITVSDENAYGRLDKVNAQTLSDLIAISPLPLTEIITEEPLIIGYIVEINEEKQVIAIVENITKKEAIDWKDSQSLDVHWLSSNGTKFEGELVKGNKIAVWKSGNGPEKTGEIAKRIIVLEK
ncbi:hypothetical protein ACFPYN_04880 [Paenisporosarcina macmurdoensis]|uniref:DUF3221 domain-containing protein n=1 Tax=Paenisporosarcina macmurdoensis TaxID=212659 RepID=A0ABW1L478_9BACL